MYVLEQLHAVPGKLMKRFIHRRQRASKGYSEKDVKDLNVYVCRVLGKALRELDANRVSFPDYHTSESWSRKLRQMADGFEAGEKLLTHNHRIDEKSSLMLKFDRGMHQFRTNFFNIWD